MEIFNNTGVAVISILFLLGFLAVYIFFILTQQWTMQAVSAENRKMPPGNLWLQLIPIFNFYWQFVIVNRLSASIALEYERLNIEKKELYPTRAIGMATWVIYFIALIPVIKTIATIAWIVCFIIYWVKINECRKQIIANQGNDLLDAERELLNS
jgi:ascorbate-specific PTS system EIIC-type component UlaA